MGAGIRGLEAFQQVEATFQDKGFLLRSQRSGEAPAALRATGVAAPPTLREFSNPSVRRKCHAKAFSHFRSIHLRDTYIFEVSKISLEVYQNLSLSDQSIRRTRMRSRAWGSKEISVELTYLCWANP